MNKTEETSYGLSWPVCNLLWKSLQINTIPRFALVGTRAWKNVNFPGSLSKFPMGRKLKTITPLWHRKRKLFSWKHCTQEPQLSLRSYRSTWIDSAY